MSLRAAKGRATPVTRMEELVDSARHSKVEVEPMQTEVLRLSNKTTVMTTIKGR